MAHLNSTARQYNEDTEHAWDAVKPHAAHYHGGNILDFGAGWGRFSMRLAQVGRVVAVDGSAAMCALSHNLVRHVPPGQPLPFETGTFTGLFIYAVLQHVPDDFIEQQCAELRRVLLPRAYMIVCEAIGPAKRSRMGHSTQRPLEVYQALLPGLTLSGSIPGNYQPTLLTGWLEET